MKNMKWLKKGIENQSIGLLPIILFMFLYNYFDYRLSFVVAVAFCVISFFAYYLLRKDRKYMYMLVLTIATFILYSLFMCLRIYPILYVYSSLVIELLLVGVLAVAGIFKQRMFRLIRESEANKFEKNRMRNLLNEFYFIAPIVKRIYMIHLFSVLVYGLLPDSMQSITFERFLLRSLPVIIGICIILFEQLRLFLLLYQLENETWLPVLSGEGRVIGRIASSVSKSVPKKYYHPVLRVMIVCDGKLFLTRRDFRAYVSPGKWDTPLYCHIKFRQTIEDSLYSLAANLMDKYSIVPHLLVRYIHETEKVKHQVSLYMVNVTNSQLADLNISNGKLWTFGQIKSDIENGIFSEYFNEEYSYLSNTIMLAEQYRNAD